MKNDDLPWDRIRTKITTKSKYRIRGHYQPKLHELLNREISYQHFSHPKMHEVCLILPKWMGPFLGLIPAGRLLGFPAIKKCSKSTVDTWRRLQRSNVSHVEEIWKKGWWSYLNKNQSNDWVIVYVGGVHGIPVFLEEPASFWRNIQPLCFEIFWKDSFGTPFALGSAVRSIVFSTSDTLQPWNEHSPWKSNPFWMAYFQGIFQFWGGYLVYF